MHHLPIQFCYLLTLCLRLLLRIALVLLEILSLSHCKRRRGTKRARDDEAVAREWTGSVYRCHESRGWPIFRTQVHFACCSDTKQSTCVTLLTQTWCCSSTLSLKVHSTVRPCGSCFLFDSILSECSECRGLIVDELNNWRVVCYPYSKFFNLGEGKADEIDWSSVRVSEKMDGTLCNLFFYNGHWEVATSGKPDALGFARGKFTAGRNEEEVRENRRKWFEEGEKVTFRDLFWKVWNEQGYKLPEETNKTFMFELASSFNPIVVQYEQEHLELHGVRDLVTFEEELPDDYALRYNWKRVRAFECNSKEQVIEMAKKLNPVEQEGFVCVDKNFNRVKIKSPQYVNLSLLRIDDGDALNERRMLSIVLANEGSECTNVCFFFVLTASSCLLSCLEQPL
jgi:hypothetical protein